MKAHLYALHDCMWMVLEDGPLKIQMENPERDPKNPDVVQYIPKPKEKWDDRDCKKHNMDNVAKAAIFKTLDPITFSKIKHLKTAMEIWKGLGMLCEGSEDLGKQKIEVLLEKFKSFKMLPGESFDMLDERFHKILNDLASLNHVLSPKEKNVRLLRVLSPKEKNVRLLRSLPAEWYTKDTAMEEGRNLENYTVQGLLDELRTYEHELKKKEEQVTPFPTALMTNPESQQAKEHAQGAKATQGKATGKPGHWKSACPYPKVEKYGEGERNEKKKKSMVAAESDESSISSLDEEALVCMERRAEKSNHENRWTMSEDDTLYLMAKDDADQEVTSQTSCSSSNESIPTSENLFDKFKNMMKDFEEINLKHSSLTEENKLLSEENLKLTKSRKSKLNEITQLKAENESLSEKVKTLNKELEILKSKEAVDKLLETTKKKGREGLGFDPSSSKRKGRTTFIPPKPTAKPNKQKGKEKEKPTEVSKKEATKYPGVWYLDSGCSRHMTGDVSLLSNLIPYDCPRVTFGGSNDFGLIKGLGNLVYKGLTIQAVSYVEGLNYNLLSISQFCDKGYSLEFCKDMASLKNISTNEVILTGKRIRNIYEVMWDDVKEACLISKVDKPSKHDHEVLDLSDTDEEVNERDRMKPTEFIPFGSLPLKTSRRCPDSDSAENHGQPSEIPDFSHDDNSGNGNKVGGANIHFKKLEAKCSSPAFYEAYLEMIGAQELSEFLHMEIRFKYEEEVLEFYRNGRVTTIKSKKNPQRSIQVIKSTIGGTAVKISQKKMKKKLHLPNSGIDIGKLSSKNLDWNTIGISGQIPSALAKKVDLKNDYKLVLELIIACLECGSGGHADDITQEKAFIINALITKTKVNWATHFFNSISKHIGKPKQKFLCQGLYLGHILESMGIASEGKKYDARYWLYYLSFKGENRASSTAEDEGSSDNVLIVSLKKSSKRKQVASTSPSAEEPHTLAVVNLDEEEEVSAQGELQKKKKRRISSPSTSGNANPENSLYYVWRAWKVGNSTDHLLEWDQQLKSEKIIKRCLGLPINYHCEQILDQQWVWQKTNEDVLLEHLSTSPAPEFETELEIPEKSSENLEKFTPPETTTEEANEEPAVEAQRSLEEAAEGAQVARLEVIETPVSIFEQETEDVVRDSLSQEISNYKEAETEEESVKTLKVHEEDAEEREEAESLPLQLYQRVPSSNQVTNFHFHSSSTSTFPDEMSESWTRKVQGLIEEISQSINKTLEIISLLSNSVRNSMIAYASDFHLQLKEAIEIKQQIATVTTSVQKQMSFLQMDIRSALAVSSANQVVTQDYLKVIADNQKEAFKLFKHFGTFTAKHKLEVIVQHKSLPPIPRLPIQEKEGELGYIPTHLNMTELILEA
ncbi:unnamed protein product [Cuscuta campestris]|uniref:Retrovirus-related Pol polyprotein from transposon TNT 1-94-like beta-barrel domain-containing protein n=1 Tax=Cuscuta campestris TaxID=132261 RepID=A0A484KSY3_9ASTE|nr:unnamed protein product [Cuscuta campestris]